MKPLKEFIQENLDNSNEGMLDIAFGKTDDINDPAIDKKEDLEKEKPTE